MYADITVSDGTMSQEIGTWVDIKGGKNENVRRNKKRIPKA